MTTYYSYQTDEYISVQEEFERAMYCPEVEQARQKACHKIGRLEGELKALDKFCWLRPDPYSEQYILQINMDRVMMGRMAGNIDEVMKYIRYRLGDELTKLFR